MTLISVSDFNPGTDAFECAGQDLMNVFGTHVLDNLNTIISDPADTGAVQTAVDDINSFRCCNVSIPLSTRCCIDYDSVESLH